MAENVIVEIGGRSKYEVALTMAKRIFDLEKKEPTKQEYLYTIAECMFVRNGGAPAKPKG